MNRTRVKKTLFSLLLIYLIFSSLLGTVVLLFAFMEWQFTPAPKRDSDIVPAHEVDLAGKLVPYSMFGMKRDVVVQDVHMPAQKGDTSPAVVAINEFGFRYGDMSKKKPEGTIRIFLVGGSVVLYGHSNETTISGFLETHLNEIYDPTVEVINAGVTGVISDQELVRIVEELIDFEPDAFVVFDGFNDFLIPASFEQRLGYPFKFKELELAWYDSKAFMKRLLHLPFTAHLTAGSHFLRKFFPQRWSYANYLRGTEAESINQDAPVPTPKTVAQHFLKNWRKMALFLQADKVAGLFILQPLNPDRDVFTTQYDLVEKAMNALSLEFNTTKPPILFRSYRHVMDDKKHLFYDIVHTYDAGNAFYAELIQNDLPNLSN